MLLGGFVVGFAEQEESPGAVGAYPHSAHPLTGQAAPGCKSAQRAIRFYKARTHAWQAKHKRERADRIKWPTCWHARRAAAEWHARSEAARDTYERWHRYHWDWPSWLPDKWQRVGACETGYGRRPGQWTWNSGRYQGAFGFAVSSWDSFVGRADPRAGPYPSEAYLATPRQQYEVALAIYRMFGFSGWGCRGA